ncbi:MAG: glycosyltransferase family 4 protein [Candidatus Margulisbacteria bacterium]|nr:glycosyltransferase family 4 protein [Candidatus Margulisiibacteriota bacterium]
MRIGIDIRALSQPHCGIGSHTLNLVKNLLQLDRQDQFYLYTCREFDAGSLSRYPNIVIRKTYFPNGTLWAQTILPFQIARDRIDVFHSPESMVPIRGRVPSIVTVHDLTTFIFPKESDKKARSAARLYPWVFGKAKKITADSKNTKADIMRLFKIGPDKIEVIPSAFDANAYYPDKKIKSVLDKYDIKQPYILTVGVISPRKNINRLIQACGIVQQKRPVSLVIAGPEGWGHKETIEQAHRAGAVVTGALPVEELRALYNGASVFAYPSVYEGFGIPILEAMACQTPVVASEASSIPEVVDDAGLLFDPNDPAAIAAAIEKVMSDASLAASLVAKGNERIRQFSWQAVASKTLELYREVAQGK